MLTKKQQQIFNRRKSVSEAYAKLNSKNIGEVSGMVETLAKKFNVTNVTIYDDIRRNKIESKLSEINASTNTITGQQNLER